MKWMRLVIIIVGLMIFLVGSIYFVSHQNENGIKERNAQVKGKILKQAVTNPPPSKQTGKNFTLDRLDAKPIFADVNESHIHFYNNEYLNLSLRYIDFFVPRELQNNLRYVTPCDTLNGFYCQGNYTDPVYNESNLFHVKTNPVQGADFYALVDYLFDYEETGTNISNAVNFTVYNGANPVTYNVGDVVIYQGNYYKCKQVIFNYNGLPPNLTQYWQQVDPASQTGVPKGFGFKRINQEITTNYRNNNTGLDDVLKSGIQVDNNSNINITLKAHYNHLIINWTFIYNGNVTGSFQDVYSSPKPVLIPVSAQINKYIPFGASGYKDKFLMFYDNLYGPEKKVNVTIAYPKNKTLWKVDFGDNWTKLPSEQYNQTIQRANQVGKNSTLLNNTNGYKFSSYSVVIPNNTEQPLAFYIDSQLGEYNKLSMWILGSFAGGNGTSGDPYQITNCTMLNETRNDLTASYILNNDINCSDTVNWDGGNGWLPIGNQTNKFKGVFDGNNKTISNLYMNRSSTSEVGFIGYLYVGEIKNLGVIDVNITAGGSRTGAIAGRTGGGATISNSYSTGVVIGGVNTGGLIGYPLGITLSNSYSTANVSGTTNVGGLVGRQYGGTISNSYSTGYVGGSASSKGGLVGLLESSGTVTNSFWDNETSGQNTSAGGTGKTTSQMKNISTFSNAGWNISSIGSYVNENWYIDDGNDYPKLGWEYPDTTPPTYSNNQTNSTFAGQSALFSIQWNDNSDLPPNGQYIFSTNNSGTWANDSAVNFTTTPSWANVTKILNDTVGIVVGYRWYATDNSGNMNASEIFILNTTRDTTPPTYSNNQTNSTFAGQSALFSIQWNDNSDLYPNGQYIFSTNNSGTWANDSTVNFTTTPSWANVTKVLNGTAGIFIGYRWYATDNAGNLNASEIFTLTTSSPHCWSDLGGGLTYYPTGCSRYIQGGLYIP